MQGTQMKLYTVIDTKAQCALPPFTMRSDGEAIRAFGDSVNKPGTTLHDHPEDFCLCGIGDFDQLTGLIAAYDVRKSLSVGTDFVKLEEKEQ